jgi:uncharacterized protein YegL
LDEVDGQSETEVFLKYKIENIRKMDEVTNTGKGLQVMLEHFEECSRNGTYLKIGFVITDGESRDEVAANAHSLHKANVSLYSIGIGAVSEAELASIAGGSSRVFSVDNYDQLQNITDRFSKQVCADISRSWRQRVADLVTKPEFLLSIGAVVAIATLVGVIVAVVLWRLGVLARR